MLELKLIDIAYNKYFQVYLIVEVVGSEEELKNMEDSTAELEFLRKKYTTIITGDMKRFEIDEGMKYYAVNLEYLLEEGLYLTHISDSLNANDKIDKLLNARFPDVEVYDAYVTAIRGRDKVYIIGERR